MNQHNRPTGVTIPENQHTDRAPEMTVTQVAPVSFALVEYGDERGVKHTTIAAIFGGKAYIPPNGEQWTAGFKTFASAINKQILSRHAENQAQSGEDTRLPVQDSVDILPSDGKA